MDSLRGSYLPWIVGIAALFGVAFAAGRYSSPTPDVKEVERIVYRDKVVEKIVTVTVESEAKRVVIYRERTTKPDGTITEREAEHVATDTKVKTDLSSVRDAETDLRRDTSKTVTASRPQWRVGALIGADLGFAPLSATLVVGGQVERRIIGPFSVGAWVLVRPAPLGVAAGGSLSLEWSFN